MQSSKLKFFLCLILIFSYYDYYKDQISHLCLQVFKLNIWLQPDFQILPSSLELLLMDSWSESETLIIQMPIASLFICFSSFSGLSQPIFAP